MAANGSAELSLKYEIHIEIHVPLVWQLILAVFVEIIANEQAILDTLKDIEESLGGSKFTPL